MLEYDIWVIIRDPHIDCICKNFNTKQGDPKCRYCLGTGQKIKIKKIKGVRQPTSGSARDMTIYYEKGIYFLKNIIISIFAFFNLLFYTDVFSYFIAAFVQQQ